MGTYLCGKSNSCGAFTLDVDLSEGTLETSTTQLQCAGTLMVETTRFGQLTVARNRIITVVDGLLGFPGYTRYVILNHSDDMEIPFRWLQSVDNPALAFVMIDPWVFRADYAIELPDEICENLEISAAQPPVVFAIVSIPFEPALMTANLQGPLVINFTTHKAKQAVLTNSPYTTKHFILNELLRTGNRDHATSSIAHHSEV
jgi:flagellar assembly factor FliW